MEDEVLKSEVDYEGCKSDSKRVSLQDCIAKLLMALNSKEIY